MGEAAGLMSGTVHPILARLESMGWVARWEDVDPRVAGRPARRYYQDTAIGAEQARRRARPGCDSRSPAA